MMRSKRSILALILMLSSPAASLAGVPKSAAIEVITKPSGFVSGEILAKFTQRSSRLTRQLFLSSVGGRIAASIKDLGVHRIEVADVASALSLAEKSKAVKFAERNRIGSIAGELIPDDRCFVAGCGVGRLWNLDAINAPAGWAVYPGEFYTQSSKAALVQQVKVAVLDTKLDLDRHDWKNVSPGTTGQPYDARFGGQIALADAADFVTNKSHTGPAAYHGTFIAGLLGAAANNNLDVAGVAYHAQLVPIAVVDGNGGVTAFDLASGINHAVNVGARVINMSLGMVGTDQTVELAIARATQHQAVMAAAAGNNANDLPFYPAWYSGVMAVTASTPADRAGSCTNHSSRTSVAAPGAQIIGLDPRSSTGMSLVTCGTSTATPHVSGLAALLVAQNPGRTAYDIRRIIEETADDDSVNPGRDEYFGSGRINVERALRYAQPVPTVRRVSVTIPPNDGGPATTTATATVSASSVIQAAELFVGRLGDPGTGLPMAASDGAFNSSQEAITATISTTLHQSAGVYRVFVRAKSVNGWGPASTSALIIDKSAPSVAIISQTPVISIPEMSVPASVTIRMSDDYGLRAKISYRIINEFTGEIVETGPTTTTDFTELVNLTWRPPFAAPGFYEMVIDVVDEAGNTGRTATRVIVT